MRISAYTWVAGSVPGSDVGMYRKQTIDASFSNSCFLLSFFSLPHFLPPSHSLENQCKKFPRVRFNNNNNKKPAPKRLGKCSVHMPLFLVFCCGT